MAIDNYQTGKRHTVGAFFSRFLPRSHPIEMLWLSHFQKITRPFHYTRRHAPLLLTILVTAVWSALIYNNSLALLKATQSENNLLAANPAQTQFNVDLPLNMGAITALHLFGTPEIKPVEIDTASLPDTTANLKLIGLFTSSRPGASRSLITEQDKPAKAYAEGDSLSGNITLFRIEKDWVIVQRGSEFEKLPLHTGLPGKPLAPRQLTFAKIAESQAQNTAAPAVPATSGPSAAPPGPQALYRELDASLAAMRKKRDS